MTAAHVSTGEGYRSTRRASSRVRSSGPAFGDRSSSGQLASEQYATANRFSVAKAHQRELAMLNDEPAAA